MRRKVVSYTLDTLPPLTDAQRKHLEGLVQVSDDQIDTSGSPKYISVILTLQPQVVVTLRPVLKSLASTTK